jgi:tetratricopeptide (TPR) repeat protein
VTEIKPDWAKGWGRLGTARFALTRYDGALFAYQKGLKLDPANAVCKEGAPKSEKAAERQSVEKAHKLDREEKEREAAKAREAEESKSKKEEPQTEDDLLGDFFGDLTEMTTASAPKKSEKEIQAQDKYLKQDLGSSAEQIGRLLAPNHVFKNLNPFYVMMLEIDANIEDVKTRYRKVGGRERDNPSERSECREGARVWREGAGAGLSGSRRSGLAD